MVGEREVARAYLWARAQPEPNSGCWLWDRSTGSHGYGNACWGRTVVVAHRLAYWAYKGDIPVGMLVEHKCHTRVCVNPDHLVLGTDASNADAKRKAGRAAKKLDAETARKIFLMDAPQRLIAEMFGIHQTMVSRIKLLRFWRHVNGDQDQHHEEA